MYTCAPPPADAALAARAAADRAWRRSRYRRWQAEGQRDAPGLRPALVRLALASLLQPRMVADAAAEAASLAVDVVGLVGAGVERALGFCGVTKGCDFFKAATAFVAYSVAKPACASCHEGRTPLREARDCRLRKQWQRQ